MNTSTRPLPVNSLMRIQNPWGSLTATDTDLLGIRSGPGICSVYSLINMEALNLEQHCEAQGSGIKFREMKPQQAVGRAGVPKACSCFQDVREGLGTQSSEAKDS